MNLVNKVDGKCTQCSINCAFKDNFAGFACHSVTYNPE